MDEAEKIKMFLSVRELKTEDTSVKEEETEKKYFANGKIMTNLFQSTFVFISDEL